MRDGDGARGDLRQSAGVGGDGVTKEGGAGSGWGEGKRHGQRWLDRGTAPSHVRVEGSSDEKSEVGRRPQRRTQTASAPPSIDVCQAVASRLRHTWALFQSVHPQNGWSEKFPSPLPSPALVNCGVDSAGPRSSCCPSSDDVLGCLLVYKYVAFESCSRLFCEQVVMKC